MNVMVYHSEIEKLRLLEFWIESQTPIRVLSASSFEQAMTLFFSGKSIDLIVAGGSSQMLLRYLRSAKASTPIILVGANGNGEEILSEQIIGRLPESDAANLLVPLIRQKFGDIQSIESDSNEYCRINVELLIQASPLPVDVFVKLSESKFVKLFNCGKTISIEEANNLIRDKGLEFLYVSRESATDLVKYFLSRWPQSPRAPKTHKGDLPAVSIQAHAVIHELSVKIGFTDEVFEFAKAEVQRVLDQMDSSVKLNSLFRQVLLGNSNYLSSHSILLAHVACCIASVVGERPFLRLVFLKLTMAAFFHDLTLSDSEFAKVASYSDLNDLIGILPDKEITRILLHPISAGELVQKFKEVPNDVFVIVAQHHELPNGNGFPRRLHAGSISFLSAIFIIAHDLVDRFLKEGNEFDISAYWRQRADFFVGGYFNQIVPSLIALRSGAKEL